MALKDIFKTKKEEEKKEIKKEKIKKKERKEKKQEKKQDKKKKSSDDFSYKILKCPHITEKSTILSEDNQYVFEVYNKANKIEIRKAVESLYGVDVLNVQIIKVPRKKRRIGRVSGWRKGYKKAIVRIKEGQKIEDLIS